MFIHVGLPKAASTTLQRQLFAEHSQIACLGRPRVDSEALGLILAITDREELEFERHLNHLREVTARAVAQCWDEEKRVVLSEESFSTGSSLHGLVGKATIASRLARLFPAAKILLVIRNQLEMVPSIYVQQVRRNPKVAPPFGAWLEREYDRLQTSSVFHRLDYDQLIGMYAGMFGKESICVLVVEELAQDPDGFVNKLSRFMEIDTKEARALLAGPRENVRATQRLVGVKRVLDLSPLLRRTVQAVPLRLREYARKWASAGRSVDAQLDSDWKAWLEDFYGPGNRIVEDQFALALAERGYPVVGSQGPT